ncbi:citrate lyase holo-[acyl-carrier protein] synthase [Bacillus sp. AFS076308]|uniref:citrate lyase holo-[acyl-carrier protein] synthase n=1 Tax=unclassified Bacillus (in: firmicutes) TaxID=185979 RepID=UPI000BF4C510|nr:MULTISPECIES: citrate lyase holo-[acyl-carrier protein] synthase [unclassified Bacillus (in: firmicutes)]PFN95675.1 citrate lyase holo-[acyl-carrier protein] synthase [Bacillus sp. AFS076308]PGV55185.1 citrate lyase holo-[acyl-carrier protein] synthase [Bacillus sp. AFS037270]
MTEAKEVTLEQLLTAREYRAAHQKELIENYNLPLISFTINIPGPVKITPESTIIFLEGSNALANKLKEAGSSIVYYETNHYNTGFEVYYVVNKDQRKLKALMLEIENEHPLGRLFDLDVIGVDGIPISRENFGNSNRKCLLCHADAHGCGRSRKHTIEELMQKIKSMVDSYLNLVP